MKKIRTLLVLILLCFACEPVRKSGKIDNQVLSVVLESKKAVYCGGEEIFIRAKVSSRLNTVRIFLNGIPTESTNRTC